MTEYYAKTRVNIVSLMMFCQKKVASKLQNNVILIFLCRCKNSAQQVGCCAHVASVCWFLGNKRFEEINNTSRRLAHSILDCAAKHDVEDEEDSQAGEFTES